MFRPALIPWLGIQLALAVVAIYWVSFFPLTAARKGFSLEVVGGLLGLINGLGALTQMPLLKSIPWLIHHRKSLVALVFLAGVFTGGMAIPQHIAWLASTLLLAVVTPVLGTVVYAYASVWGHQHDASERAMVQLGMATGGGMILGPVLFGVGVTVTKGFAAIPLLIALIWLLVWGGIVVSSYGHPGRGDLHGATTSTG